MRDIDARRIPEGSGPVADHMHDTAVRPSGISNVTGAGVERADEVVLAAEQQVRVGSQKPGITPGLRREGNFAFTCGVVIEAAFKAASWRASGERCSACWQDEKPAVLRECRERALRAAFGRS